MKDTVYHFITGALDLFLWSGELVGEENLPKEGPAVFVANHLGPIGPISVVCALPLRLYSWIVGEMVDKDLAAEYLRIDFIEPRLKLRLPFSRLFSKVLSRITVPMMKALDCIPAYVGGQERLYDTLKASLSLLLEGKHLLVFPEYSILGSDSLARMYPFQKTVFRLGEMYYESAGQRLPFYPVAIHESGKVMVGRPVAYNPLNSLGVERHRLKDLMEETVKKMYLQMAGQEQYVGALTPQHK
jgi:1-acyl-sn-glycerol-3-phosphate acyltransferase